MGSMAQDARHEQILENCRQKVTDCEALVARLERFRSVAGTAQARGVVQASCE
jgi:nucleoside 2-deoxyribosyltransferase